MRDRESLLGQHGSLAIDVTDSGSKYLLEQQQQHQSMQISLSLFEKIKGFGSGALSMLGEQKETLKEAQRKILDIGVMIGVSHSTLKMAERRDFWDRVIFWMGVVCILLLLVFVWYWKF